ncbi:MAG: hypothetical protein ACLR7U_12305 [Ruthenibacterium lactatiformans]
MNWKDCGGRFKAGEAGMEASASRLCSAWRKWGRRICVHTMPFFWMWNCPKDGSFAQELRGAGCSADIVFYEPSEPLKGYTVHAQDYIIIVEQNASTLQWIISPEAVSVRRSTPARISRIVILPQSTICGVLPHSIVYTYDKIKAMRSHSRRWKTPAGRGFKKRHRGYIVNLHAVGIAA